MKIKSNAKINLSLKVIGKAMNLFGTGYLHYIESVMVPINIYDYIEINESATDEIIGMDIPMESNLMYKALCKVRDKFKIEKCVKITIDKRIPVFAGLGGGSGNAASIILALNEMWGLSMTSEEMINLGKKVGSDVSFFIKNRPSFVYGTGDKISLIKNFEKIKGILVFDGDKSSTKEVYDNIDEFPFSKPIDKDELNDIVSNKCNIKCVNDLEKGLNLSMIKKINQIKRDLELCGAKTSLMSGSGGSVFGIFEDEENKNECCEKLKNKYKFVCKFETLSQ